MGTWKHQGIIHLNDKKFLFIPKDEKLFIKYCYVDGIICNRKDYDKNLKNIETINIGIEKKIILIFLDEL